MAIYLNGPEVLWWSIDEFDRGKALTFFLSGHIDAVIAVYDNDGYLASTCYRKILGNYGEDMFITEVFSVSENLFEELRVFFAKNIFLKLPVTDKKGNLIYYAEYDFQNTDKYLKLLVLNHVIVDVGIESKIHIKGFNEVLFCLWKNLVAIGAEVTVEGEEWQFFDCIEMADGAGYAEVVVDEDCEWIDELFSVYAKDAGVCCDVDNELFMCFENEAEYEEFINLALKRSIEVSGLYVSADDFGYMFVRAERENLIQYYNEMFEYLHNNEWVFSGYFFARSSAIDEVFIKAKSLQFKGDKELFSKRILPYLNYIGYKLECTKFVNGYEQIVYRTERMEFILKILEFGQLMQENCQLDFRGEKILFLGSEFPYFIESIEPLIDKYLLHNIACVIAFPLYLRRAPENMYGNIVNYKRVINVVKRLQKKGVICVWDKENVIAGHKYKVCYILSGYCANISAYIKDNSKKIVALQTTAYYTHVYMQGQKEFLTYFGEDACKEVDYLVATEFIREWINSICTGWENKILTFGYPKLDDLYKEMKRSQVIQNRPEIFQDKKKIVLVALDDISSYISSFENIQKDVGIIWRPHPLQLGEPHVKEALDRCNNIMLDTEISYASSFAISDALIVHVGASLCVNYLYTQKPLLLVEQFTDIFKGKPDFREEAWYKAGYVAAKAEDIVDFIDMIRRGEDVKREEQSPYRELMTKHFDGKVCERIYNYFED